MTTETVLHKINEEFEINATDLRSGKTMSLLYE
jgi:hypothetical protein